MSGRRSLAIATAALATACETPPDPNPWMRAHTEHEVRALAAACGTIEPQVLGPYVFEARRDVEAPVAYRVSCSMAWNEETSQLWSIYVSIIGPPDMQVTRDQILPVAEVILRELPPGPRAIARYAATGPRLAITVDRITITGGVPPSTGSWSLHAEVER